MKTIINSTIAIGLALSFGAPVSATELDGNDPIVASFYRDLHREPTQAGAIDRTSREQDRLPGLVRTALNGGDPVVASFTRELNHEPAPSGGKAQAVAEQDHLPELVRVALERTATPRPDASILARRD